eukprot:scaffold3.g6350.t1
MSRATVLALAVIAHLAAVTAACLWPLRGYLSSLSRFWGVVELYSLGGSNLDVFALSWVHCATLLACLRHVSGVRRIGVNGRLVVFPHYTKASYIIYSVCTFFKLLLLAKAVAVAVLSDATLLPPPHGEAHRRGDVGLLCMFASIVASLVASFVEEWATQGLVLRWRKRHEAAATAVTGPGAPLLGGAGKPGGGASKEEQESATIAALLRLAAPDTPILLLAFTAGAVAALGKILDYASIDPDPHAFRLTTLRLLGVALGCAVFTGVRGGLFTVSMTRLNVRIRKQLFASLMNQDTAFFDMTKTGEITSRLSADTTTVSDQICLNLNVMLRRSLTPTPLSPAHRPPPTARYAAALFSHSLTQAAMVLAFMFIASWRLTVVTFVMIPLVLVICKLYGAYYRKMSKRVQTELAEANSVAEEALSSMTTVKAHAAEASTEAAYAGKLLRFYHLQFREAVAYALYMSTNTFLSSAVVAVVLFYGGSLVLDGIMSAGSLISFMLYQQSLSSAFTALGDVFSALSAAVGAADKVVELMARRPGIPPPGTLAPPQFAGKVALRDVVFAYPARPQLRVLSGLSLEVQPGEIVALVGPSGGGKSSIVKLVERFYVPSSGRVLIDDRDAGEYAPSWLKRRVALVSQEPVLYARSVRRNIVYGLEAEDGVAPGEVPGQEEIEEAARLANAHQFISALPDGYDTECGEKGVQLSGGQKQRIAIARALVRRPTVLLLDEATSALDADSEAVVQEALDRTMKNRTVGGARTTRNVLVIAHRLSTIQDAHRIVVIQHGCVAEVGTHEELLERGGTYASLVRRQLARGSSSAALGSAASSSSLAQLR